MTVGVAGPDPNATGVGLDDLLARWEPLVPPVSAAGAAVTMVLRSGRRGPEVLLIERARNSDDPASGQVALPGGRVSDGDGSLAETALRELEEEVGLKRLDLVGPLRFVRVEAARRFGLRVGIFAGKLADSATGPTVRSPEEVAHVFWLPIAELEGTRSVHEETQRGLAEVPATIFDGHVVWGFTRRILRESFGHSADDPADGPTFAERPDSRPDSQKAPESAGTETAPPP